MMNGISKHRLAVAASQNLTEKQYWLDRLSGDLVKSMFPFDFNRTGTAGHIEMERFTFKEDIFSKLMRICRGIDLSLHIVLTAGIIVLLHRYTGDYDIVVGIPVFKQEAEDELINTVLAFRTMLRDNISFKELILQQREKIIEDVENQNYPIEILLEQLNIPISDEDFPLFDTAILLENLQDKNHLQHIKLNMVFSFLRTETAIEGTVEYNASMYRKSTVERIIKHFSNLLESALSNMYRQIYDIEILSEEEKRQLLVEFNDTVMEYPKNKTVHRLFEEQLERTPDYIAVIGSSGAASYEWPVQLSYRELDKKSNRLAHLLIQKGVVNDTIIGIMVKPSIEIIIGILGILKSGGAYLPIVPIFPETRINYILADSGASILLTDCEDKKIADCQLLIMNYELLMDPGIGNRHGCTGDIKPATGNRQPAASLAYVIYTSGSTGRPKGAMIEHKKIVNFIMGITSRINFQTGKSILAITTIIFDIFVLETLLPLTSGMKIVIAKETQRIDPDYLDKLISINQINMIQLIPTTLGFLMASSLSLNGITEVIVGGEAFPQSLYERLKHVFPGKIYNLYGPTETTIWSTLKDLTGDYIDEISIGSPISNTQVYILDRNQKLLPIGVKGELYVGGDGVARGYLSNPGLTHEKFIKNPFRKGERLYSTGDLARWLSDGNIEYLGRVDFQVKIRGFRIELGEIENRIVSHSNIKEAIVLDRSDENRGAYICAYIVVYDELDVSELREYLSGELPDYMIPAYFVQIDKIPLTANGKVDRNALLEPSFTISGGMCVKPKDEVENRLADIWADVLGIEKESICIDYSFFEMGGNSLKVGILVSKIHKELGLKVMLADIFKQPTIREFSKYIKKFSVERYISIEPIPVKPHYELSSPQKRLYILQQMDKIGTGYNMPSAAILDGDLDKKRLENSIRELTSRHESLRTRFRMMEGIPVQIIEEEVTFEIEYHKLETWGAEEKIINDFVRSFQLDLAPLLRVGLIEMEKRYILMIDMHHIISDGTSIQIFINELMALYQKKTLPHLRIQYKDYCQWQRDNLGKESIIKQKEYWMNLFKGEIPTLEFPADFLRPVEQSFEGHVENFEISIKNTKILKAIVLKENATLFMILLSVFNIFLAKVCIQEDIVVGTPTAGRNHSELQGIIGMFANTLPIRNHPESQKVFIDFLKELKGNVISTFENQDFQYEEMVEALPLNRDTSRNPLFDVMFVLQNMDISDVGIPGLKLHPYSYGNKTSKFDLTLQGVETASSLKFLLEYSTRLFKKETILRFIGYFKQIVDMVTENPTITLSQIEIIDEQEKRKILEFSWGNSDPLDPVDILHLLFEIKAEVKREATALVFKGNQFSYNQLHKKSNQLARFLRIKGVKPNSIVGLLADRSIEMVLGMLAILKAGGAYLPIDTEYPDERKKYMLTNTDTKLLLTNFHMGNLFEYIPENIEIIDIRDLNTFSGDDSNLDSNNKGSDLVYVIYTSGSAGMPKGVMQSHRNLVNLIQFQLKHTQINFCKVLQYSPISFDVSFQEIFSTLLAGGELYLIDNETRRNIPALCNEIKENQIKTLFLPSVLLRLIFKEEGYIELMPPGIEHIVAAGERLIIYDGLRKYIKENNIYLHNHYGPTETHVVTTLTIEPSGEIPDHPSIGKPISNTYVYILDKTMHLQPVGIPGEICVSGFPVSKGYWGSPEPAEKKFVSNPFSTEERFRKTPYQRVYKTGDYARWMPDGNIEFLGRVDNQVKIKGYRLELEEIENQIQDLDFIKESVVNVWEEKGEKYLCAYIVSDEEVDLCQLRNTLAERLPNYMVPSSFVKLTMLPLTSNEKIDRKKLPCPENNIEAVGDLFVAPRTHIEEKLSEIWSKVLRIEKKGKIGIDNNFFKLGGDSLKAMDMVARVYKELKVEMSISEIFKKPTIRWLSELIGQTPGEKYIPLTAAVKREYYELSSAQSRIYQLYQMDTNSTGYNIPYIVSVEGVVEKDRLENAFKTLFKKHEILRTSYQFRKDKLVQKIHDEVAFNLEYHDLTAGNAEDTKSIIEKFVRPFDLSQVPLLRAGLIKLKENKYIIMIDIHHINLDGITLSIFIEELVKTYKEEELKPLLYQYKDYSEWENYMKESEEIQRQKEFWVKQFEGEIPVLELPIDNNRPVVQSFEGSEVDSEFDSKKTKLLKDLAFEESTQLNPLLFTIYNVFLSKICNQHDIVVGIPSANPIPPGAYGILGIFVNTLALRNYPEPRKTFRDFLREVIKNRNDALRNMNYPYNDLVSQLVKNRDFSRNPLFDTMFLFQNLKKPEIQIQGLNIKADEYKSHSSKFDLTLHAFEEGNHLCLKFEFSKIFKTETINRFKEYFENIADIVSKTPDAPLSEIGIFSEEEKHKLLDCFNNMEAIYPENKTITVLFEEQADKTPDDIALAYEGERLTYKELDYRANQLARLLKKRGIQPDTIVAMIVNRSLEINIGILGILKAGGAYLPIEPEYPEIRILQILKDSASALILTQKKAINNKLGCSLIFIDDDNLTREGKTGLLPVNKPCDLAYVIYTSGAMGKPKGIMVEHKNVINLIFGLNSRVFERYGKRLEFCLLASYMFDASIQQIFGALLLGHCLNIVPEECRRDGVKLLTYYNEHKIDVSDGTPYHIRLLLEYRGENTQKLAVKHFLIGGEALSQKLVKRFFEAFQQDTPLITNVYGPAECCVDATFYEILKENIDNLHNIPIGIPMPNYRVYIVNIENQLQPIGVAGELCISGIGVVRGYLGMVETTSIKFVGNPFIHDMNPGFPSIKMYHTGDMTRWMPDGNIEFLGRMDQQVKIRGFRIELEEIENHLMNHDEICAAVAAIKEVTGEKRCADEFMNKYLCAYYVAERELEKWSLQSFLSKSLPAYMIPTHFFRIEKIPLLTPNSKINRNELPEPEFKAQSPVAPRYEIEKKLKQILEDALKIKPISIFDSFFDLGTDSISATTIANLINQEFGVKISIKIIYEYPTISELSSEIKKMNVCILQ